jgi:hypothetical protein
MPKAAEILYRYRAAFLALAASGALHAAIFVGMPRYIEAADEGKPGAMYSASLDPATTGMTSADQPAAAPRPRRAPSRNPQSRLAPPRIADDLLEPLAAMPPEPEIAALADSPEIAAPAPDVAPPEVVALAQPAPSAISPAPALPADPLFPVGAMPSSLSVTYQLNSAFADGRAVYTWNRDGDNYTITGEAEAVGFFTLFLEGRILQESRGTVTPKGLRPERFVERKPNAASEGLDFDWSTRQVTMDRGDRKNVTPLTDNTVDWLSMIFQLAHQPPKGDSMELRVFTQRKLYRFQLKVLGEEDIRIPLGTVRALHLRHVDPVDPSETVDVWLGVDQHYVPVKLRYPVARNRLMVEQLATKVTWR